jgi:DNA-binding transcriptional MerR regulator
VKEYSLADLMRLSGYSSRRIRQFIKIGLLGRPKFAGVRTMYSRETLGRLSAIMAWRRENGLGSPQIKREMRALTLEEVENWAEMLDPEPDEESATPEPPPAAAPVLPAPTNAQPREPARDLLIGERWVRVPLVPGLDLTMLEGSGELVVRLAREIQAKYQATGKSA